MQRQAPLFRLEDIDRVLERVTSLGVPWRGTRFEIYREELQVHASPTRDFIESVRRDDRRKRLTFETGAQIVQLVMAETIWDQLDVQGLKAALKVIFDNGPAVDALADDLPRNTLLELVAAALLSGRFAVAFTELLEDSP